MLVLAAVSEPLDRRLMRAAGHRFRFVTTRSWDEGVETILSEPVEMAVVDPVLSGEPRTQEIERMDDTIQAFILHLKYLRRLMREGFEISIIEEGCVWSLCKEFPKGIDESFLELVVPPPVEK